MLITQDKIAALKPCNERYLNFIENYPNFKGSLSDFILLTNITYSDKVWVFTRLATVEQSIKWSILCTESVLSIFENQYPNDNRPRKALEAAKTCLETPSSTTADAAYADAYAAADVVYVAADVAYAAAYAAADVVYVVDDKKTQENLNLELMLEAIKEK